jgi:hypothetical protein
VAISTSWYIPAGAANDFMWTPAIELVGTNLTLTWNAVAYDVDFADGYEVRIMTVEPTGGTGDIGNQLTNSELLLTVPAENPDWTPRTLNLTDYAGQTVYIGFRNNSVDQFVLAIDDIVVQNNTVVPLHSLSLSGNSLNGKNNLNWNVIGTDNRYDLTLQNSLDGSSWQDIYQATYTPGHPDFSYSHSTAATKSFYRVKALSPAGRVYVSNTVLITQKNSAAILLYPTLAKDRVNIQGNLKNATIVIADASGKKLFSQVMTDDSRSIDVSRWASGLYFMTIITRENNTHTKKFIVRH